MDSKKSPLRIVLENNCCQRVLYSCPTKEGLKDEDKWTFVAEEEMYATRVTIYNETQEEELKEIEAEFDINNDRYSEEINALEDKYLIIDHRCFGGGNSIDQEEDEEDGIIELTNLDSLKPETVRLGLIEDLNDNGEIIGIADLTNEYDISEDYKLFFIIKDGKLIELDEYDNFCEI